MAPVRADVIAFLNGDAQLDGLWFGDVWFGIHRPAGKGAFWWRKYLPATPARDGAALIAAERQRQLTACGWTPEHDDQHRHGELSAVAAQLALGLPDAWGLHAKHDNATNDVRRLTIAGALIAAERDR